MAEEKCKGCQSFCMLGKQLVSKDPVTFSENGKSVTHNKSQTYPTEWEKLKEAKTDVTIAAETNGILTVQNYNSLLDYIKAAWNEGAVNCNNMKESIAEWQSKHSSNNAQLTILNPSCIAYPDDSNARANYDEQGRGETIKPIHYNFPYSILNNNIEAVTQNPRGENISNDASSGPQAGTISTTNGYTAAVVKSNDLIKGEYYKELYDQAKKLQYHPYQCNYCNIFEGGEWNEIVEAVGTACSSEGLIYSWNKYTGVETDFGYTGTFRQDCSGFVNACVNLFNKVLTGSPGFLTGNSEAYKSRANLPEAVQPYFEDYSGNATTKGSIVLRYCGATNECGANLTTHVEIYNQWSGGGNGDCINGQADGCHEASVMMHRTGAKYSQGLKYLHPDD